MRHKSNSSDGRPGCKPRQLVTARTIRIPHPHLDHEELNERADPKAARHQVGDPPGRQAEYLLRPHQVEMRSLVLVKQGLRRGLLAASGGAASSRAQQRAAARPHDGGGGSKWSSSSSSSSLLLLILLSSSIIVSRYSSSTTLLF